MEENIHPKSGGMRKSRIWSGFGLLIAGVLLLAYKMGAPIPGWLFTWPVLLIVIGLLSGIKSGFHNPGSFIMILVGGVFLIDQTVPGIDFHNYIIPVILIGLGLLFILRPKKFACEGGRRRSFRDRRMGRHDGFMQDGSNPSPTSPSSSSAFSSSSSSTDDEEYIDVYAVFGGIKKNIQSKNFKGGEVVSFMGGSEINFMQSDIQQPIVLEVNNVFGGTKLIIPSNWDVKNEISAVFGGVEDKRTFSNSVPDSQKRILIKGSCVFGGVEVTNY